MSVRKSITAVVLAVAVVLPGCAIEQWTLTWPPQFTLPFSLPGLEPPAPKVSGPPHGTLVASRAGNLVVVEARLANVPEDVTMVAAGLKLHDRTPLAAKTISLVRDPEPHPAGTPKVDFDFGREGTPTRAAGGTILCVQVTYELENRPFSVHGSTFTLVLGYPDGDLACQMGTSAGVYTRDGGPLLCECVRIEPPRTTGPPAPPAPRPSVPTISFLFIEPELAKGSTDRVWIVPRVASVSPPADVRRPTRVSAR